MGRVSHIGLQLGPCISITVNFLLIAIPIDAVGTPSDHHYINHK